VGETKGVYLTYSSGTFVARRDWGKEKTYEEGDLSRSLPEGGRFSGRREKFLDLVKRASQIFTNRREKTRKRSVKVLAV